MTESKTAPSGNSSGKPSAKPDRGSLLGTGGIWLAKWSACLVVIAAGAVVIGWIIEKMWVIVLPVALVYGRVSVDDILLDRNRHPEVARLSAGMRLVADPALDAEYPARYSSVVEVVTRDGRLLSEGHGPGRGCSCC